MPERVAVLGLDVGDRRIGVAGCDGTGLLATGLGVIQRKALKADIQAVQQWIQKRQATVVVIGLPLHADGSLGIQAQKVQRFTQALEKTLGIQTEYVNEYLSTVQAEWDLQAAGVSSRHQKAKVDQQAAAVILQTWLDQRRERQKQQATLFNVEDYVED